MNRDKPQNHDPNLVSKKFLADLVGKTVVVSGPGDFRIRGILRRFDNYCAIVEVDGRNTLVWKGPGMVVQIDEDLRK